MAHKTEREGSNVGGRTAVLPVALALGGTTGVSACRTDLTQERTLGQRMASQFPPVGRPLRPVGVPAAPPASRTRKVLAKPVV